MPCSHATPGCFPWCRLAGGAADYQPGCLQLPCAGLALATSASPIHHQLLPRAMLPCSLCSQLKWSLLAIATCQHTSQQPPRCFSCSEKLCRAIMDHGLRKKNLSSGRIFFFCPLKTNQ